MGYGEIGRSLPAPSGQVGHTPTSSCTSLGVSVLPLLPAPLGAQSTDRDCGPAPCGGVLRPRLLLGFRTRVCLRRKPSLEVTCENPLPKALAVAGTQARDKVSWGDPQASLLRHPSSCGLCSHGSAAAFSLSSCPLLLCRLSGVTRGTSYYSE